MATAQTGSRSSCHSCDASIWAFGIYGSYGRETFTWVSEDGLRSQNMCGRNKIVSGAPELAWKPKDSGGMLNVSGGTVWAINRDSPKEKPSELQMQRPSGQGCPSPELPYVFHPGHETT